MNINMFKNNLVRFMFLSLFSWLTTIAMAQAEPDLYVEAGFPYKNLVERYDTVKIHYSNHTQTESVKCRVELISDLHTSATKYIQVEADKFSKEPLKSCIKRKDAIQALELTFSD